MTETSPVNAVTRESPLAIICGGGSVPLAVADAVMRRGRRVILFPIRGWADPAAIAPYPHHWISLGQFGRFCRLAQAEQCHDAVLIGTVLRPSLTQIRLDWTTARLFLRIARAFRGGDDHLLSSLGRIFEDYGFRLFGAHEVAPEILMPEGRIGNREPRPRDRVDIARAVALLETIGPYDVGQAAVVADGHVLAIEAAEGTDRMLARVAELRVQGRIRTPKGTGVLVKTPKSGQDRRFDLPSIGPQTIEGAVRAGLAGVAISAGATIVAEPQRVATMADKFQLFVFGMTQEVGE